MRQMKRDKQMWCALNFFFSFKMKIFYEVVGSSSAFRSFKTMVQRCTTGDVDGASGLLGYQCMYMSSARQ